MKSNRFIALTLCAAVGLSMALSGCGEKGAGDDTTFSWWIYSGADASYYTEYVENPAVQYTLGKTWGEDDKKISLEFWQPASGTAQDNYNTMITSGDLPDIIDAVISDNPLSMYEKGYTLDITEYVEKYMPNYKALVESNETIKKNAVYLIDGEERYLSLANIYEDYEPSFQGYMYRRDWIVKYGKNPETGEAFTGGYTDSENVDSWEDDVVFPSGSEDPLYISDWEWMFEIFETALAEQGIDDSYCLSMYYPGFTWSGGLCSCFGESLPVWYMDDEGIVKFGAVTDNFRAYLECLNTWYEKGWLDQSFNERTSDAFYAIDSTSVRQGKVGMWVGQQSELSGRMDLNDGGLTEGIYVAGAPYPINDLYGTDECKYVEPRCFMAQSLTSGGVLITKAAEGKDMSALFSYLDYFYGEEGSIVKTLGLDAEQASEVENSTLYADNNLSDGAYTIGEDGRYVKSDVLVNDGAGLLAAASFEKAPGLQLITSVDLGYTDSYQHHLDCWSKYPNKGFFQGTITTNNMSEEDSKTCSELLTKIVEFMTNNAVDYIKGTKDITNDKDWKNWCTIIGKYNYQKASDIFQKYVELYPFI